MADSTRKQKPVNLVSEIGGRPLSILKTGVGADPVPIGEGEFTHIYIQCPNTDADGEQNASSIFFGTAPLCLMELVPGQYSPKIEGTNLRDIYVRVAPPIGEEDQTILDIPAFGKLGERRYEVGNDR